MRLPLQPKLQNVTDFLESELNTIEIKFFALVALGYSIVTLQQLLHFCRIFVFLKEIPPIQLESEIFLVEAHLDKIKNFGSFDFTRFAHGLKGLHQMATIFL